MPPPLVYGCLIRARRWGWRTGVTPYGVVPIVGKKAEVLATTASLGTKKERLAFKAAIHDVIKQVGKAADWRTDFWPSQADPCLQVVDYCAWAIQRKWERNDSRSYDLIADRITYQYDLWQRGKKHYY